MVVETTLGDVIQHLTEFGFFTVLLPFFLVYVLVYAVLEKSFILGKEGEKSRKNLNSIVAFVVGLFFVGATQLVTAIGVSLPMVALALIAIMCFMMLVGAFIKQGELSFDNWKTGISIVMAICIILIFAYNLGWIDKSWFDLNNFLDSETFMVIFAIAIFAAIIYWVSKDK